MAKKSPPLSSKVGSKLAYKVLFDKDTQYRQKIVKDKTKYDRNKEKQIQQEDD
jgi:hypothetical protein